MVSDDRQSDIGAGEPFDGRELEAVAGVPEEMAQAAQHVMDQRPGEAEQDELAEPVAEEALHHGEIVGRDRRREQPPDRAG